MPKIPVYDPQTTPGVVQPAAFPMQAPNLAQPALINPEEATSGFAESRKATSALIQSFQAITEVGNKVTQIGEQFHKNYQTSQLNRAKVEASKALSEKQTELQNRNDYWNFDQEWQDFSQKQREKMEKDTSLAGPYLDQFLNHFDADAVTRYPAVRNLAREKGIDDNKESLMVMRDSFLQQIATADTPERARAFTESFLGSVQGSIKSGMLKPTEGYKLSKDFLGEIDKVDAERMLLGVRQGTLSPADAEAKMNHPASYMHIDPILKEKYKERLEIVKNQRHRDREMAQIDGAYTFLHNKFAGDPDASIRTLQDPAKVAELSSSLGIEPLNVKQTQDLINIFKAKKNYEDHEVDRLKKENGNKATNDFYGLVNQGKPGAALSLIKKAAEAGIVDQSAVFQATKMLTEKTGDPKTDEATWVKAVAGIYDGSISTPMDLLKAGVRGDKFAQALDRIDRYGKADAKEQINYFKSSVTKYFQDDKDLEKDQKKLKQEFVKSLDWWMRKESLNPNDPQVGELGDKLMGKVVKDAYLGGAWNVRQPLYEWLGEKKPWLTGKDLDMGGFVDKDIPGASKEEIKSVNDLLRSKKLTITPLNKARALESVRQGVDISKIGVSGEVPKPAQQKIETLLKGQGKPVTPANIQSVWDHYGNKVMEE